MKLFNKERRLRMKSYNAELYFEPFVVWVQIDKSNCLVWSLLENWKCGYYGMAKEYWEGGIPTR